MLKNFPLYFSTNYLNHVLADFECVRHSTFCASGWELHGRVHCCHGCCRQDLRCYWSDSVHWYFFDRRRRTERQKRRDQVRRCSFFLPVATWWESKYKKQQYDYLVIARIKIVFTITALRTVSESIDSSVFLQFIVWLDQGSPNFFVQGPHKVMQNMSRAGRLT